MGLSLQIEDLAWSFQKGAEPFLKVTSWNLEGGQMAAVLGPSGSGKSTLLFLLAGLEVPTSGRLLWGGRDLTRERASRDRWRRTELGLVFQDFQLVPELTAVENVLLPLTFGRFSVPREDRRRAVALLERMGVERPQARASTLSRGEMQRTALARAVLGRPPVLLADEPTASLDAVNEAAVVELLKEYSREGATVIVSTHQPALRDAAHRRVTLDHGSLSEEA